MKETFGKIFVKGEKKEGAITPFQALCTALAVHFSDEEYIPYHEQAKMLKGDK